MNALLSSNRQFCLGIACALGGLGIALAEPAGPAANAAPREPVQKQAEPLVASLNLSDERRKQIMAELKRLDEDKSPPWATTLGSPDGRRIARESLARHGYTQNQLAWVDALPDDVPADVRGYVVALHARQLLRQGPPDIEMQWPEWDEGETPGTEPDEQEKQAVVIDHTAGDDAETLLNSFIPRNVVYRSLHASFVQMGENLDKLRAGFIPMPPIQDGEIVKAGDIYQGVPLLTLRLTEEGYYDPAAVAAAAELEIEAAAKEPAEEAPEKDEPSGPVYSEELAEAVKRFQEHHGREADGILGPNTLEELNRSPDQEYEILRLNLHRARMLPDAPGDRFLIVNIPSTHVFAFSKSDTPVLGMRTIVGQTIRNRQTPVFRDVMTLLEFAPYWNVPVSIAGRTIVPNARKNSGYLEQNNFEIVPSYQSDNPRPVNNNTLSQVASGSLLVHQKPGPKNALGSVKFLFPNDYAIYLHDTPDDELFDQAQRDFSNGCIRVENPAALAEFVLGPQGWDRERVEQALARSETKRVEVEQPINVYIIYLTAFPTWDATDERQIRFYPDIYSHDQDHLLKVNEGEKSNE
ncbi:MAG: L,D-transpeptidase family protein [Akkermansiaceae bacterium]